MNSILLLTLEYPPDLGGVATYLSNLAARFPAGRVRVLAPPHECAHETDMRSEAQIFRRSLISNSVRPRWLPALLAADRLCRKEKPAAIIVSHLLPMGLVACALKARRRIPYIVITHGLDAALALSGGAFKRRQAQGVLAAASLVVANSAYTAQLVKAFGVGAEKIMIVRPSPGIPENAKVTDEQITLTRNRYSLGEDFTVLSAGRLVGRKRFGDVISAVAFLRRRGAAVRHLIVGDGPERQRLERLSYDLGISDAVRFAGAVSDDQLPEIYAAADVFAMTPSMSGPDVEGFGIVYLEAGLTAKPVIGSRSGGVPEAVIHGKTGLLVDPGDVAALAEAILRLKNDAVLHARLGRAGRERVLQEFGWQKQAAPLLSWVEDLAEKKQKICPI